MTKKLPAKEFCLNCMYVMLGLGSMTTSIVGICNNIKTCETSKKVENLPN